MTAVILPFPAGADLGLPGTPPPPELPRKPARGRKKAKTPIAPLELTRPPRELTEEEQRLQTQILDGHFRGERLAKNHDPRSVARDRIYVEEFLAYVGQPIWECTPDDFSSWAGHLGLTRMLAARTQRTKQTAIAAFWDYAMANRGWQNQALKLFGCRIEPVATRDNRIIHTCDNTPVRKRAYLDAAELEQFFSIFDLVVEMAAIERPRLLKVFQRDRAMFYTYYVFGLRLEEGHGINLSSFSRNPDLPELGPFGRVGVWGKGARGSGPRFRTVPATLLNIAPMLTWYLEDVRPKFKDNTGRDRAMWLAENGNRLSKKSIWSRYKNVLKSCGLEASLHSTHGLRHAYVSHQQMAGVPLQYTSSTVGHSSGAVTQRYTHLTDDYMRSIAANLVRSASKSAEEEGK